MAIATGWRVGDQELDISAGLLLGVVNVTPDSFSDGGRYLDADQAIRHGLSLQRSGAGVIDVGGESTRPGATPVPVEEELDRVMPVVEGLVAEGVPVSIDTYKPLVAARAIEAGASVVNDVKAATVDGMEQVLSDASCGVILMHMRGEPPTMQESPEYEDVVDEVGSYLRGRVEALQLIGVDPSRVAIDPGIGFGKTPTHNLQLLRGLSEIAGSGRPVVLGTSRKKFLTAISKATSLDERDEATAITTALGFASGARVFRVHDAASSRRALAVSDAIVRPQRWDEWLPDSNHVDSRGS